MRFLPFLLIFCSNTLPTVAAQQASNANNEEAGAKLDFAQHVKDQIYDVAPGQNFDWYWSCTGGGQVPVQLAVSISDAEAGHAHSNPGRPVGSWSNNSPTLSCDGNWNYIVTYRAPSVSGMVAATFTRPGLSSVRYVRVSVPGLIQLPTSPYIVPISLAAQLDDVSKNLPHDHPNNHWGKPALVDDILNLAKKYFFARQKKLYVNDMSLKWGGVLDYNDTWSPPHQTHQDGRHVDIRKVGMTLDDQVAFRRIAEGIFGQRHVCVDGTTTGNDIRRGK